MIREPIVAGRFYPGDRDELKNQIGQMIDRGAHPEKAFGIVSPHAGYPFSGEAACKTFSSVNITDTVIILGPNHTGFGKAFALYAEGSWRTPLGEARVDKEFCGDLLKRSKLIQKDATAHLGEHSLEVQVPILQYFKNDIKIVPIVAGVADIERSLEVAGNIADTIKSAKKDILIIASSDMTHYESRQNAERKDKIAIGDILRLDEKALFDSVQSHDITMCGYVPAVIMLSAVKALGAASAKLVTYSTSGDITGDYDQVVGYAGIVVK